MPKGQNHKAVAANDKKAANKSDKDAKAARAREEKEAVEWSDGAKSSKKKEDAEAKRQEELRKKKEREAALAAEEKELSKKPVKPAKDDKPARGAAKVAERRSDRTESSPSHDNVIEFVASNIDDALDLLTITGSGGDVKSSAVERHPEKRMKAAYAAFEERELPILKTENPGLRLSQLKELLAKRWKKSPENPLNQQHVSFDASRDDEREIVETKKAVIVDRLKVS
ncbi:hypothetical protein SeMB42_g01350 [Synchytrium endobioticum]|uniref:HMG box domain-containing protein n=1 Tax=Synchytrium endobioticum TaxID=286115 RepID=A0A507DM76_9FUNG|nr:hypothetical protein SeLEV6574_g01383 [Synchytrium endobioticum]TPX52521.1 hypothetical protein SeMB42_g01350 [Synchytrium endobioticum]